MFAGHIGINVPDVDKACDRFEELGVKFVKKPNDGESSDEIPSFEHYPVKLAY